MKTRLNLAILLVTSFFSISWLIYTYRSHLPIKSDHPDFVSEPEIPNPNTKDGVIIVAHTTEDVSWLASDLPEWQHAIYHMNINDSSPDNNLSPDTSFLQVPVNKGREAMAYLTYIIDHYALLPSTMIFLHAHKDGYPGAWHTDAPHYSNVYSARFLRLDYVQKHGYVNMRCTHSPGCPDEIQLLRNDDLEEHAAERAMTEAWIALFGGEAEDVPKVIAAPCCGQFAVSRDQVLKRELEEYVRFRGWLLETDLTDYTSGRVFEYLWHVIFGREAVYCPNEKKCYCEQFGRCKKRP